VLWLLLVGTILLLLDADRLWKDIRGIRGQKPDKKTSKKNDQGISTSDIQLKQKA